MPGMIILYPCRGMLASTASEGYAVQGFIQDFSKRSVAVAITARIHL